MPFPMRVVTYIWPQLWQMEISSLESLKCPSGQRNMRKNIGKIFLKQVPATRTRIQDIGSPLASTEHVGGGIKRKERKRSFGKSC